MTRALILAGGQGSRLRPLTASRPKPLLPLVGRPFVEGLLIGLAAAGCADIGVLVGADPEPFAALPATAAAHGVTCRVIAEPVPLGTAGQVRRVLTASGRHDPVVIVNGDVLTDLDVAALRAAHRRAGAQVTLALTRVAATESYGVVTLDAAGQVTGFMEKPAPGTVAADTVNAGCYVLDPAVFTDPPGPAARLLSGDGPLSFETEVFPALLAAGARLQGVVSDAVFADLGTPARYRAGHALVLTGGCAWPVPADLPSTDGVAVHTRSVLAEDVALEPPCTLAAGTQVGAGARLRDVVAGEGCVIGEGAVLDGVVLGAGARVGAGAVLTGDVAVGEAFAVPAGARHTGTVRLPPV